MSASLVIRRIEYGDIPSFHRCLDTVAREGIHLAMTKAPNLERITDFIKNQVIARGVGIVAVADDDVVGWCDLVPGTVVTQSHSASLGMGLLPAYRGQGLGKRLLDAAIAAAREKGFHRITLQVNADNAPAIALYRRAGFVHEGTQRDATKRGDSFCDSLVMGLIL